MQMLVDRYALNSPTLGELKWRYVDDLAPATRWGQYEPSTLTLGVSKAKTRGLFLQQIKTVLHEIQHWNQHAAFAEQVRAAKPETPVRTMTLMFVRRYKRFADEHGAGNPFETDADEFAHSKLDAAAKHAARIFYSELVGSL